MKKKFNKLITNFNLLKNNFFIGIGSILNVFGFYYDYNYSKTYKKTDFEAIFSDWKNVGEDIITAEKKFLKKNKYILYNN